MEKITNLLELKRILAQRKLKELNWWVNGPHKNELWLSYRELLAKYRDSFSEEELSELGGIIKDK